MYKNFIKIIENEEFSDYSVIDLINTSVVTFYASFMLKNNVRNLPIEHEIKKYTTRVKEELIVSKQKTS